MYRRRFSKGRGGAAGEKRGTGRSRMDQGQPLRADGTGAGRIRQAAPSRGGSAMMYYLHLLSEQIKGFNVFSYVTFRAVAAAVTAFVLSLAFGNFVIRKLIALKIGQPIRTADEVHRLAELHSAEQGVPTMGGVLIIGTGFVSGGLWARPDNRFVWLALFSTGYPWGLRVRDAYLQGTQKHSGRIA